MEAGRKEMKKFNGILKVRISIITYRMYRLIIIYYGQKYQKEYPKGWNFPKAHTHIHMFDDIRNKGVTRNFNTKPNESAHRPLKKFYLQHTNFKNFDPQVSQIIWLTLSHSDDIKDTQA